MVYVWKDTEGSCKGHRIVDKEEVLPTLLDCAMIWMWIDS